MDQVKTHSLKKLSLPEYHVNYETPTISIDNFEKLQVAIQDYADRYSNLVVTPETEKASKKTRVELRKLYRALDDRRKEIKKDYVKPYKDFEANVKLLEQTLQTAIDPIDQALKDLAERERQAKQDEVKDIIAQMAPNYHVKADEIEIDPTWLNKSTSKPKILDGIAGEMVQVKQQHDKLAADLHAITKYAEVQKLDPSGWVDQLKQGQDVNYLMDAIDRTIYAKKLAERQAEAKAAEERTHQETHGDEIVDTNTGEVVSKSVVLKITATIDEMNSLKRFLETNQIKFERVYERGGN